MTLRYGRYEAVGTLGEGAMAAVHLARDPVLDRLVAVKVLHRNVAAGKIALQRFFNEAKTVARMANPHVVEVFDFGKQGRDYFLVMEFVDGLSLRGLLEPSASGPGSAAAPVSPLQGRPARPLPDAVTVSLLCQAVEGLEAAARHGVVHRDIKPENLMINSQGYLKVGDFGIAHLQDDSLTRTGAVLGSPLYMSPEQVRGAKPITSQSDMFSLGAVFYRCLAGHPPFASSTLKDLFLKIAREAPPPLALARPDLDPALLRLVETLLQKDPSRRGDGPRWLRSELRAWLFARGQDDPMERVGRYLRDLDLRAHPAAATRTLADALPRTLLSAAPMIVGESSGSYAAVSTLRDASGPADVPRHAGTGKPSRAWWRAIAVAGSMAAVLGAGILLHFRAGSVSRTGTPDGRGLADMAVESRIPEGHTVSEGYAVPEEHEVPKGGAGSDLDTFPLDGHAGAPDQGPGERSGLRDVAGGPGKNTAAHQSQVADLAAGVGSGAGTGTGTLLVQSAPPFARVFLDGQDMGVAPVELTALTPGPHRLLIKGRTGAALDTLLDVKPGRRVLRVRLDPETVALENAE